MADSPLLRTPQIHASVYVAPGAVIVGDVALGQQSSVWFQAVLRGDSEAIRVGSRTNIQDGCILHADPGYPCVLGNGVTLGHGAIVHGAQIEDDVLVGMRAVVMNGARVGTGSILGVGAVVTEGTQIPAGSLVLGLPAKVRRMLTAAERERIVEAARHYVERAQQYQSGTVHPYTAGNDRSLIVPS